MAVALSGQMARGLASLSLINDGLGVTGGRLSSGKAVETASDNAAVYFRAKAFSTKSEDLDTTNSAIKLGVSNLTLTDKALGKMQDNLGGTLSTLRDARAKAVTQIQTVSTAGGLTYADTQATAGVDNQVWSVRVRRRQSSARPRFLPFCSRTSTIRPPFRRATPLR